MQCGGLAGPDALVGPQLLVAHMGEGVQCILGCVDTHRAAATLQGMGVANGKDD